MIDHDRLFKELLSTFFLEFVELFLPDVLSYLERDSLVFLDKELFTDVTSGERHEADLVVKAQFRGQASFFLIHVESQAQHQAAFSQRMFRYFARLYNKLQLTCISCGHLLLRCTPAGRATFSSGGISQ